MNTINFNDWITLCCTCCLEQNLFLGHYWVANARPCGFMLLGSHLYSQEKTQVSHFNDFVEAANALWNMHMFWITFLWLLWMICYLFKLSICPWCISNARIIRYNSDEIWLSLPLRHIENFHFDYVTKLSWASFKLFYNFF